MELFDLFLFWTCYSFLGWVAETIYCSIPKGKFVERGFLNGPMCPIYGFGGMFVILILEPYVSNVLLLFTLGLLATSTLEYFTSYLMEKIFNMKWWDYTIRPFNIRGRVCLLNSVLFGILCVVLVRYIHPLVKLLISIIPIHYKVWICTSLFIIIFVDFILSVIAVVKLTQRFVRIHMLREQVAERLSHENLAKRIEVLRRSGYGFAEGRLENLKNIKRNIAQLKESYDLESLEVSIKQKLKTLITDNTYFERRLIKSFPNLSSRKYNDVIKEIRKSVHEHRNNRRNKHQK